LYYFHYEFKKNVLHFSEFSTIFYTFYKFLQSCNTIEDGILHRDPCKETELCNWVPRPWEAAAPAEFRRASRAPGGGGGGARTHAHLGRGGERGLSREGSGEGNVAHWVAEQASMATREQARRVGRTGEGAGR
jgi:hypothetical protein